MFVSLFQAWQHGHVVTRTWLFVVCLYTGSGGSPVRAAASGPCSR